MRPRTAKLRASAIEQTSAPPVPTATAPAESDGVYWMREAETNLLFAHTLSVTASANFERYADRLQQQGHLPPEVVTNVFAEEFTRKRTDLTFRRLQFVWIGEDDD